MKRAISILLVLAMCLSLTACKSKEVKNVEKLIDAIGEVTLDSEGAVVAAENAYAALSEEDKSEVENYAILTAARSLLDTLIYEAEMNAKYDAAIALLNEGQLEEAYAAFVELGDWKDAAEYVARFTILENVHIETNAYEVNAFGEETLDFTYGYGYDTQGRLLYGPIRELPIRDYSHKFYSYDELGNIIEYVIRTQDSNETDAKNTYYYDEEGNLERTEYLTADGYRDKIFYEEGLMTVAQTTYAGGETQVCSYSYEFDNANHVTKRTTTVEQGVGFAAYCDILYEYDSDGRMVKETRLYHNSDNQESFVYVYEDGILVRCELYGTDGRLCFYSAHTYGDYYIYTPAQ